MRIATSWDLVGDLGAAEGPPITYNWTAWGMMPQLLPWLAILALLALKPNRRWSAWWIWIPLACLVAGWHYVQLGLQSPRSGQANDLLNVLIDVPRALAFGVAALWLLAPYLGRHHRFRTFLRMLFVLAVFGVFSFAVNAGWDEEAAARIAALRPHYFAVTAAWDAGAAQMMLLALLALVIPTAIPAAMVLCGLVCRRSYRPLRLCLGLLLSLLVVWVVVLALLYVLCLNASPGSVDYAPLFGLGLLMVAVTFATLLPFLVLSWVNALFAESLKALFHLEPQKPAPGICERENTAFRLPP